MVVFSSHTLKPRAGREAGSESRTGACERVRLSVQVACRLYRGAPFSELACQWGMWDAHCSAVVEKYTMGAGRGDPSTEVCDSYLYSVWYMNSALAEHDNRKARRFLGSRALDQWVEAHWRAVDGNCYTVDIDIKAPLSLGDKRKGQKPHWPACC